MGRRVILQTEAEWLTTTDPDRLVCYLRQSAPTGVGERSVRLIQVACARKFWDLMTVPEDRATLLAAEQYAEGKATREEVRAAYYPATDVFWAARTHPGQNAMTTFVSIVAHHTGNHATTDVKGCPWSDLRQSIGYLGGRRKNGRLSRKVQADIVRDVVGNPFRPVAAEPSWLTSTVTAIARGTYEDRAFDRLPILADALEEAGCADELLLAHCRGPDSHVRGCWALDILLGQR